MTERNRAAVWVYAIGIEPALFDHAQRLRGEGFVEFDHVNIRKLKPRDFQSLGNRVHRADSHFFRLVARGSEGNVASQRLDAQSLCTLAGHDHRSSSAV